ncbi:TraV family lipoprotein [Aliidiomarina quisquiliarum]|uniref:TraV family lipoprotein n=1 Tax=Aliidiomarina quisquiliarum TaxID=2938947 RepID=UPI00208E4CD0|nr:TraV family lipoprotein [Aliidiomarina quisquiliarum]MCO4319895.1 TraV family lipoprotein [Aliidiomarina quisquiliarum]
MNYKSLALGPIALAILTGCSANIGKSEFACPNGTTNSDGVCAGPRVVYELTHSRTDLSELSNDPEYAHLRPTGANTSNNPRRSNGRNDRQQPQPTQTSSLQPQEHGDTAETIYRPRDISQQSPGNYQRAEAVPQQRFERQGSDEFQGWPNHDEPLAPEPLAVFQAPEIMRVLVAAWPDSAGNLNMPGYVYVEVTERKFNVGSAANKRPTRVVPFQMRQQSQEELRRQQQRSQGVNPLGVENPLRNRNN